MKYKFFVPLLFILFILISCKKDESPTEPENTDQGEVTISSNGGTLKKDDAEINISSGTFQSDQKLTLNKSTIPTQFTEIANSSLYTLENVPAFYEKPIEIKIKLTDANAGESFLAMQVPSHQTSRQSVQSTLCILKGTVSNGTLTAQLPNLSASNLQKTTFDPRLKIELWTTRGLTNTPSADGKFIFYHKKTVSAASIKEIEKLFTDAYNQVISLGFDLSIRTRWPFEVVIQKNLGVDGEFISSNFGRNSDYIRIEENMLSNPTELKATIAHEFLHFAHGLYCPSLQVVQTTKMLEYAATSNAKYALAQYWMDEATSTWFEPIFLGTPNSISNNCFGNLPLMFKGYNQTLTDPQSYGYAMGAFIKYLAGKYSDKHVSEFYKKLKAGNDPLGSINIATGHNLDADWHSFIRNTVEGTVVPNFLIHSYMKNESKEIYQPLISNSTPKKDSTEFAMSSLSARVVNIKFGAISFSGFENKKLKLKISDGELTIYKAPENSSKVEILSKGLTEFTIEDVRALKSEGKDLIIIITKHRGLSPYTSTSKIKFTYEFVDFQNVSIDFTTVKRVDLRIWSKFNYVWYDGTVTNGGFYVPYTPTLTDGTPIASTVIRGEFPINDLKGTGTATRFTLPITAMGYNIKEATGECYADYNPATKTLSKFYLKVSYSLYTPDDSKFTMEIEIADIPASTSIKNYFSANGTDVFKYVKKVLYKETGRFTQEIKGILSDPSASVTIDFY